MPKIVNITYCGVWWCKVLCIVERLWPLLAFKRPWTWINNVLAFCRVGRKYVGLFKTTLCHLQILELTAFLLCLTVTLTFGVCTWNSQG